MVTADVAAFLAAVHDADEQAARAAGAGRWDFVDDPDDPAEPPKVAQCEPGYEDVCMVMGPWPNDAGPHIARHDPQSVLARVEAERALVALHEKDDGECSMCAGNWQPQRRRPHERVLPPSYPCPTLRALAWGYRQRKGWRAEWAPEGVSADA